MKNIGIIGCGAIGTSVVHFVQTRLSKKARIVSLCDIDLEKAKKLSHRIRPRPMITGIENVVKKSDLIIEAAGVSISGKIAQMCVSHKKDVLIMSTGGLLKKASLLKKARIRGSNIYMPSGAICGLDGLSAARVGRIKKVTLTTRKPLKVLKDIPFLKKRGINRIKQEHLVYDGTAEEAIKYFPKNINVSATLSIMGIGSKHTKVRIITSPRYTKNTHEIEIEGDFGKIFTKTENIPSDRNPKTSLLAVFSALAKLEEVL